MKRILALVTLLLFAVVAITGCGGNATEKAASPQPETQKAEKMKVAFIYVGPVGDAGWTYAHDEGRKYLEEQLKDQVVTEKVESVPENTAECERVLETLVQKGNKVIFATSFGFMDAVQNVAKRHPDVIFMHCSGYKTSENSGTYFGRDYQARYLTGIVAGKSTKNNTIGYVAAMPIPEVIRGINGFTQGVRSVNPNAKVKVVWTNTWIDSAKEKQAAVSLLEQGCDVITQHQDSPAPMVAAQEAGKLGIGYNSDMRKFAPQAVLTAPVWNWGPYYVDVVKSVINKTWKSGQYWGPIKDGIIDIGPYGPMVTEDVQKLVAEKRQAIVDGKLDVFGGPLKDNTGKEQVAAGNTMTDEQMLNFNWFVEGVDGVIPAGK